MILLTYVCAANIRCHTQETRIVMAYEMDWKSDDPTCLYNDPDFQPVVYLINGGVYCPRILNTD